MTNQTVINAPLLGTVAALLVEEGNTVTAGDTLVILEVMKVQTSINAPHSGVVSKMLVELYAMVEKGTPLLSIEAKQNNDNIEQESTPSNAAYSDTMLVEFRARQTKTLDSQRIQARDKRHQRGNRTARENLAHLCDPDSFHEYGQLAVAAQRGRTDFETLQSKTAADGIITGIGNVNSAEFSESNTKTAIVVNDYSVLAGTQGFFHHMKLDRILEVAKRQLLPVVMYSEGGGGRPGDTDVTVVNSGLQCASFSSWAGLAGVVPRVAIGNGYNFAGNAALFGAADITIATTNSWIGMAGPAMITGGGLGQFKATDIGPIEVQSANGVVDIVADDEQHATELAKTCLGFFQGKTTDWKSHEQSTIADHLPSNRRFAYQVRDIITTLADQDSFIELKPAYGGAIVTGLARLEGIPVGIMANDCNVLGGAIDVPAGEKAADFMQLCSQFSIPILSLCDTPGFMVGPEHEELGAVRRLAKMFTAGALLTVPMFAIVLRKCYGLGAQAMVGGSTSRPDYIASWPTGEFGPMGLEGAVELGFKKELDAQTDPKKRQALFDQLLAQQYARGQASEVATSLEIDAVIEPSTSRAQIISMLKSFDE